MKEPINVITNLAYFVVGLILLATGDPMGFIMFAGLTLLTVGSAAFHATGKPRHQTLDEIGMYAALVPLAAAAWLPVLGYTLSIVLSMLTFGLLAVFWKDVDSFVAIPGIIIVALLGLLFFGNIVLTLVAAFVVGAAFYLRQVDPNRGHGKLHGAWHVLSALAYCIAVAASYLKV